MSHNFKKGEYEKAVEHAKALLENNVGMSDILAKTNLCENDVKKIIEKRQAELNDNHPDFH
ncbi:hypothetical protein VN21_08345 [Paraclostridium benzoelyticum]|uniref:Uncharacterized protein n=1 Tax=Paraclostridium benzoelyticum TaxID=1629550 RepID=A0A0M3DFW9_9FIRM|nr:hypothetical protein [Paraclostridium benzoelyticum]KKY01515.1 hypothetical protein VN21_08345 [Paraclostridium benzoelyticum]